MCLNLYHKWISQTWNTAYVKGEGTWNTAYVKGEGFPRRHLTSLRSCTSRLSSQNDEICFQKYLPISGKLSITNYLKQNSVDYRSHLTIQNKLKVEKKGILFRHYAQLSLPPKNAWDTRRNDHTKKLESNNYAGTLSWKVFIASQVHWKWSDNIWKREVCNESMTKFSYIHFFVRNVTISC